MDASRHFYSTESAAKALGCSVRSIGRISENLGLRAQMTLGARGIHIWTAAQVKRIGEALQAKGRPRG